MSDKEGTTLKYIESILMAFEYFLKLLVSVFKCLKNMRVKVFRHCSSITLGDDLKSLFMVKGRLIRSYAPQGIVLVSDNHNSSFNGYILSFKSFRITASIPSFMVGQCNPFCHLEHI